jgi:hypothetical protein
MLAVGLLEAIYLSKFRLAKNRSPINSGTGDKVRTLFYDLIATAPHFHRLLSFAFFI